MLLACPQVALLPLIPAFPSPVQKLIFNRVNGKRPQVLLPHTSVPEESYTAAHEENVRFIYEGVRGSGRWGGRGLQGAACLGVHPQPSIHSLAGGGAATGRGAEGGERPWACAVCRENPEPPAEK